MDRVLAIGIVLKGLSGLFELVGGILLLLVTPTQIHGTIRVLTQDELLEDPHDYLASRLPHTSDGLTGPGLLFGAAYLLIHAIVKVVLVAALLRNKVLAYPLDDRGAADLHRLPDTRLGHGSQRPRHRSEGSGSR